jgi:phage tail sheath protein FI
MATYRTPGVYVEEISTLPPSVAGVSTAIPAFIGYTQIGPTADANGAVAPLVARISTMLEYRARFGSASPSGFTATVNASSGPNPGQLATLSRKAPAHEFRLYYSLSLFFQNGGGGCYVVSIGNYDAIPKKEDFTAGLEALEKEDEPTLIVLADAVALLPDSDDYYTVCTQALAQCKKLGDRFAILDVAGDQDAVSTFRTKIGSNNLSYGAAYYPALQTTLSYEYDPASVDIAEPDQQGQTPSTFEQIRTSQTALYNQIKTALSQQRVELPSSPAIAGVYASIDRERGVWKAPANVSLASVIGPVTKITHEEQEGLNDDQNAGISINAIRAFTGKGTLVWGARTLAGNDNEWRYVPVRRLFIMIEESVQKATAFAVFEPNDATTWLKVKAMIESYLYGLWEQGALAGSTPEAAYYVQVGLGKTMTPDDVLNGRMIVEIGVAAVRPAEFIILRFTHKLQQA